MSKLSFSIKFYLLNSREKAGKHPVYCRIVINKMKTEFSLGEWVDPKDWNEEAETFKKDPELKAKITNQYMQGYADLLNEKL